MICAQKWIEKCIVWRFTIQKIIQIDGKIRKTVTTDKITVLFFDKNDLNTKQCERIHQ